MKAKLHTSITLIMGKNGWPVLYFTPKEIVRNSCWMGGQVGSRAILDTVIVSIKVAATSMNLQSRLYMVISV